MKKAKEMLLGGRLLPVKVTPGARTEEILGWNEAGELQIKVRAKADGGEANKAVLTLLSDALGLPKSSLGIARGASSRHKMIAHAGRGA